MANHKVPAVNRGSPDSINRLAAKLRETFPGRLSVGESNALAITIAMTHDGWVSGFWGSLSWKHENGQLDDGDVTFEWS